MNVIEEVFLQNICMEHFYQIFLPNISPEYFCNMGEKKL